MRLMISQNTAKKVSLFLGVASVAASAGNVAVKAGPALQTLNNLTNTSEFTINNTYGQSFSVDGIVGTLTASSLITPFAAATGLAQFNASTATLTTGFSGVAMGNSLAVVSSVAAFAAIATAGFSALTTLSANTATGLPALTVSTTSGTQTVGASISSTLFGPSTVKATTSFTNQLINDLSAF